MNRDVDTQRLLTTLLASVALGAVAMFVLDPDKGRRRRAVARDKARSLLGDTRDAFGVAARDASHRMQGWRARARRLLAHDDAPDDLRLIERVRARMGRLVSHPHAIQVGANAGRVTLSGPILAHEAGRFVEAVGAVWGVSEVEDRLILHENAESISSLQGGADERRTRPEGLQEHWTPTLRVAAILGGSAMSLYGLRHRSLGGMIVMAAGVALTARGATNLPMRRLAGIATGRRAINLQKTIHVGAPPEAVYEAWTNWENLPRFMSHVQEVRDLGDGRTHWIVSGPVGTRLEWDARLTRHERPHLLAWRTEPDSLVQHVGSVQFEPFADGTRVTVRMAYDAAGAVGHALATLLGSDPKRQIDDDLARMKSHVEQQALPQDAAQPDEPARPALH
jgi:uncharacterized membrane protein